MNSKFIHLISVCILTLICMSGCRFYENEPTVDTEKTQYDKLESQKAYSESLLTLNYCIGTQQIEGMLLSSINKDGTKKAQSLKMLFSQDKRDKFVIRYNQIGCNTCVDLFFKNKKLINQISKHYDILVLVAFTEYQDYIVWKKTSEIETGVYWVNMGDLPFDNYFKESSYCFVVNSRYFTSKYFTPNNQFPDFVNKYINNITIDNIAT